MAFSLLAALILSAPRNQESVILQRTDTFPYVGQPVRLTHNSHKEGVMIKGVHSKVLGSILRRDGSLALIGITMSPSVCTAAGATAEHTCSVVSCTGEFTEVKQNLSLRS